MGYVFDFKDALAYEKWCRDRSHKIGAQLERRLMIDLLRPAAGESILDIGCGTGLNLIPLLDEGLQATGIDPSPYMLDIAHDTVRHRADLHRGFAENLPFEDNSFTYACLNTTLEFVDDPQKALEEAFRVTKDRLFVGILNRYALKGLHLRVKGKFFNTIYKHARFFSIWELKNMIRSTLGDAPVSWRTVCQLMTPPGRVMGRIERYHLVQRCPFGAFAGIVVTLMPKYRTRPLELAIENSLPSAAGNFPCKALHPN